MTPEEHAAAAETLITNAWQKGGPDGETFIRTDSQRAAMIASAQVHATMALYRSPIRMVRSPIPESVARWEVLDDPVVLTEEPEPGATVRDGGGDVWDRTNLGWVCRPPAGNGTPVTWAYLRHASGPITGGVS